MDESSASLRDALADRYRLDREIGQGATAVVFLAEDLKHHRPVALKVLRAEITALLGPQRFLQEIEVAARLTHPHILPLYDSGTAGNALYYVMPFVAGESLRDRIAREKQLPVADALRITREVASALGHAHRQGIVHRDIKPENLLLQDEHVRVTDFGIARAMSVAGGERMTRSGVMLGTPAYMSPEQTTGGAELDPRSDFYGLGCVLYEMLAGQPPFTAPTTEALVYQHMSVDAQPVTNLRPTVPAEVAALVQRMLAKNPADRPRDAAELTQALDAALARTTVLPVAPAAAVPAASVPAAPARLPSARRVPRPAIVAAAALALLAAGWFAWRGLSAKRAPAAPGAVAVLPFTVRGSDELEYLGEGMVDLLSTSLDGAAELRRVDPHAVLGFLRRRGAGGSTPEQGAAVATHFGAPMFVLGDVMQVGGRLRLQASLYERTRGTTPIADASAEGDPAEISSLVDRLAAALLSDLTGQRAGRLAQLATVTTHSLPALKAYLEGEQSFRRGRFLPAVESFRAAVKADSTFALAWYRLSATAGWLTGPGFKAEAAEAGRRAARLSDRLMPRDRELLLSRDALNTYRVEDAERHAQVVVQSHPDDAEAWVALGEVQFHGNPFRGRTTVEARAALERAVFLDPGAIEPQLHLLEIALKERRIAAVDSIVGRLTAAGIDPHELVRVRMIHALVHDDGAAVRQLMHEYAAIPSPTRGQTIGAIATGFEDPARAERLIPAQLAHAPGVVGKALAHGLQAALQVAQGRWQDARESLHIAAALDTVTALFQGAYLAGLGFLPVTGDELDSTRVALARWRMPANADTMTQASFYARHNGYVPVVRTYLLGLLALRAGDERQARERAGELDRATGVEEVRDLAHDLAAGLRARAAWSGGDPAGALRLLEARPARMTLSGPSGFRSRTHERFMRAELLRAVGRDEEALGWYGGLVGTELYEITYLAPSHLRRAEIHEKHGRTDRAIHHYRRFLELWKDCDPELRPEVDRARQRLERLTALRG